MKCASLSNPLFCAFCRWIATAHRKERITMNKKNNQTPPPKVNRALYVVSVALLFVVAVIIAVMGSAGKKAAPKAQNDDRTPISTDKTDTTEKIPDTYRPQTEPYTPDTGKIPETDAKAPDDSKAPVSLPAPTLSLPANGIMTKSHSTDIQVYSQTMGDYRVHRGIDISTAIGESVYAAADGKVTEISNDPLYGITVAISHSGDMTTYYKNLDEDLAESIEIGYSIKCGEVIGVVGDSAMVEIAEEPHLHFEVSVAGRSVDPTEYLDESALVSLSQNVNYES